MISCDAGKKNQNFKLHHSAAKLERNSPASIRVVLVGSVGDTHTHTCLLPFLLPPPPTKAAAAAAVAAPGRKGRGKENSPSPPLESVR